MHVFFLSNKAYNWWWMETCFRSNIRTYNEREVANLCVWERDTGNLLAMYVSKCMYACFQTANSGGMYVSKCICMLVSKQNPEMEMGPHFSSPTSKNLHSQQVLFRMNPFLSTKREWSSFSKYYTQVKLKRGVVFSFTTAALYTNLNRQKVLIKPSLFVDITTDHCIFTNNHL